MSALADALVAAQRRALAAMEKQYVAGKIDGDTLRGTLSAIGLTDEIDQDRLTWALDTIKAYGAELPAEPRGNGEPKPPEKSTDSQRGYIAKLLTEQGKPPLAEQDLAALSKDRASEIIGALKAGTYDPATYDVPF